MSSPIPPTPVVYDASTVHVRREQLPRQFRYGLCLWLVDVDELPIARGFGVFARFRSRDHVGDRSQSIRANIDEVLAHNGVEPGEGPVLMLAAPAFLGYVFNPLSLFWCYDGRGGLRAVVAEVHNTYGGRHTYVLGPDDNGHAATDKQFLVSPFLGADGRYELRVPQPDEHLNIRVRLRRSGKTAFVATLTGTRHSPRARTLTRLALRYPFPTLRVAALIRWQGLRLWLRRVRMPDQNPAHQEETS
ncbi:DUF1365 domain-containing protein [Solicola gregarius]|uniref:DUF1365 domain-containing protein n=1 Tax=Solicola gregarius TaxID=2908642 RepID=A0AA46THI3_9ACTN|nr:DUF1365 domain-containing protein [Solicola gregarius]UYM04613.1 DUF1365 domain-containing protein [Solicola gregarius]